MVVADRDQRDLELVEALLCVLDLHEPPVRTDVVAAARARLAAGAWPTAFEVAGTVVAEFA